MKKPILFVLSGALIASTLTGFAEDAAKKHEPAKTEPPPAVTPSPKDAKLYFITPKNGKTVKGEFVVRFGLKGMGVAPAGVYMENTGHHHMLIDMDVSEIPKGTPIPTVVGKSLHYGKGQTETKLKLPPGKHTLQLVLGNYSHMLHEPPVVSKKITITVAE